MAASRGVAYACRVLQQKGLGVGRNDLDAVTRSKKNPRLNAVTAPLSLPPQFLFLVFSQRPEI